MINLNDYTSRFEVEKKWFFLFSHDSYNNKKEERKKKKMAIGITGSSYKYVSFFEINCLVVQYCENEKRDNRPYQNEIKKTKQIELYIK